MGKRVNITGVEGLYTALRAMPREAGVELRDASQEMSNQLADQARSKAMGVSRTYASLIAPTIRARRDRVPIIAIGSRAMIPGRGKRPDSSRQRLGDVLFGVEFGGGAFPSTRQFLPHLGTEGYALWPTIRQELPDVMDRWADALFDAFVSSARRGA